jgi:hypothetical protein
LVIFCDLDLEHLLAPCETSTHILKIENSEFERLGPKKISADLQVMWLPPEKTTQTQLLSTESRGSEKAMRTKVSD